MLTHIPKMKSLATSLLERDRINPSGACLYYALAANQVCGLPIVAGSLSWKFTSFDNGTNPNYFSYIFEPMAALQMLNRQRMPEMHCWNIYQDKVFDLTTCYLPQQAKLLIGEDWEPALIPPDFYHGEGEIPEKLVYAADPFATHLAKMFAAELLSRG